MDGNLDHTNPYPLMLGKASLLCVVNAVFLDLPVITNEAKEMKREDIAWDYLKPIERAQLIHFYPELAEDKQRQDADRPKVRR